MKKTKLIISAILMVAMSTSLIGCGNKGNTKAPNTKAVESTKETAKVTNADVANIVTDAEDDASRYRDYARMKDYKFVGMSDSFSRPFSLLSDTKTVSVVLNKELSDKVSYVDCDTDTYGESLVFDLFFKFGVELSVKSTHFDDIEIAGQGITCLIDNEDIKLVKKQEDADSLIFYDMYKKYPNFVAISSMHIREKGELDEKDITKTLRQVLDSTSKDSGTPYIRDIALKESAAGLRVKSYKNTSLISREYIGTQGDNKNIRIGIAMYIDGNAPLGVADKTKTGAKYKDFNDYHLSEFTLPNTTNAFCELEKDGKINYFTYGETGTTFKEESMKAVFETNTKK